MNQAAACVDATIGKNLCHLPPDPGLRILVVDDNCVNQKLVKHLLQRRGHVGHFAGNGQEALAALAAEPFDLVLMDCQMPVMDGYTATAALRAREVATGSRMPVLAMTAHAMPGAEEKCLAAGMDAYLAKPFRHEDLFAAIDRLMSSAGREGPLDVALLAENFSGEYGFFREVAEVYFQVTPDLLGRLSVAVAAQDTVAIMRAAHALRSSTCHLAASAATDAAGRLESMVMEGWLDGIEAAHQALVHEFARLERELHTLLDAGAWPAGGVAQAA